MKPLILTIAGWLLAASANAAEASLPKFPEVKTNLLPLSLLEEARQRLPLRASEPVGLLRRLPSSRPESVRLVSKMPILVPGPSSPKMLIAVPDNAIDYKRLVKNPDVESVK